MAELSGESTYVCTLDAATQKKAEDELNEDSEERTSKIQTVRDWIEQHPYILSRTDDLFILRFLRICKFNVSHTQRKIEQFCINRTISAPAWFSSQDVDDPNILEILEKPILFPLPKPKGMKDGPCYVLGISNNMNTNKDINDLMRVIFMKVDTLVMDENIQVHGMYTIQDSKGAHMESMRKIWTRENIKKSMKVWKDVYPTRIKQLNFVNMSAFMNTILEIFKFFMGKKLADRMKIHYSEKDMAKTIPKECLPNEYGGNAGTIEELYAPFREKVLNNRQEFQLLKQCRADEEKMPKRQPRLCVTM